MCSTARLKTYPVSTTATPPALAFKLFSQLVTFLADSCTAIVVSAAAFPEERKAGMGRVGGGKGGRYHRDRDQDRTSMESIRPSVPGSAGGTGLLRTLARLVSSQARLPRLGHGGRSRRTLGGVRGANAREQVIRALLPRPANTRRGGPVRQRNRC